MAIPLVSIGFPVYNGEALLAGALDTILCQEFRDFELVIADNASTDRTGEICRDYASRDPRIRYFRNATNIGVNPNHDHVFKLSRGEYFMWTAHDLKSRPQLIGRCLEAMNEGGKSTVLVYPQCEMIVDPTALWAGNGGSIASRDPRAYRRLQAVLRNVVMVYQLYGLIRSDALRQTRLNGNFASSDYVLLAELAMVGEIREIPDVLISRRIDSNRGTAAVSANQKAWLDWSRGAQKRTWQDWLPYRERLAFEYFRGACGVPMDLKDKFQCLLTAPLLPYVRLMLKFTGPGRQWFRRLLKPSRA